MQVALVLMTSCLSLIGYTNCQVYDMDDDYVGLFPNGYNNNNNNARFNRMMHHIQGRLRRMQIAQQGANQGGQSTHGPGGYSQRQNQQQKPLPFGPSSTPYRPEFTRQASTFGSSGTPYRPQYNSQRQRSLRLFNSFLRRLAMADFDLDEILTRRSRNNHFVTVG